jgi:hypothetical protein
MKKLILLTVVAILGVSMSYGICAANINGTVFLDLNSGEWAPCATVYLCADANCTEELLDPVKTNCCGDFSFGIADPPDTVWVKVVYVAKESCLEYPFCSSDGTCSNETQTKMVLTSDPSTLYFDLEQPDCYRTGSGPC